MTNNLTRSIYSTKVCPSPYTLIFRMTIFENDYFEFKSRASCVKQTAVSESLEPIQTTQVFLLFPKFPNYTLKCVKVS